jgi:transcriptional regulator with XRE-family HTH domain
VQVKKAFGTVLKEKREAARLSQEQLGLECGLSPHFIYLLEGARRQPSITTVFELARALEISPKELVAEVERRMQSGRA